MSIRSILLHLTTGLLLASPALTAHAQTVVNGPSVVKERCEQGRCFAIENYWLEFSASGLVGFSNPNYGLRLPNGSWVTGSATGSLKFNNGLSKYTVSKLISFDAIGAHTVRLGFRVNYPGGHQNFSYSKAVSRI